MSAQYYKENKEDYERKLVKDQNLSKEEKEKSDNMVVNVAKISKNMKKSKLVAYRKKHYRMRKSTLL